MVGYQAYSKMSQRAAESGRGEQHFATSERDVAQKGAVNIPARKV